MDLLSATRLFSSDKPFTIHLETGDCLHALNRLASCEACYDVCPAGAIQPGKPPSLDNDACVTCGACLPACPAGAFTGEDYGKALLTAALRAVEKHRVRRIDVLCDRRSSPEFGPVNSELGLRLPGCLAQLGAGIYLGLAVLGVEKVCVRLEQCDGCPRAALKERIAGQAEKASRLLASWGKQAAISCIDSADTETLCKRPGWNAVSPPLSRAELLRPAALIPDERFAELISPDPLAVCESHLSLDRYRQMVALERLPAEQQPVCAASKGKVDLAGVTISAACNGCGRCAQACPTRALERTVSKEQELRLIFSPLKCINCGVCAALCPENVLALQTPVEARSLLKHKMVLHSGRLVKCQRCGAPFLPKAGENLCSLCQFRRENPFGSRAPQRSR